ncbi:hypothetical protein [Rhodobacter calidifons]|uniref:DUF304 domain-containing protein n=1 Tax=Rhodobacter calidifons TaxID=2715277 RepID=A0ABX0G3K1_9RHOB|nr:hypothetical protein [Rhodobacter calidifons]NHB75791.1 hypothetical protein [Rhodobacter calidifons]
MRIRTETPALLVLEDRPLLIALLLSAFVLIDAAAVFGLARQGEWAGVAMLGLGIPLLLAGFVFFVRRTIVFFDRSSGMVSIRVASLIGQKEDSLPLSEVIGAEVQRNPSSKGGSTARPVLLLKGGGRRPLLSVSTSGRGPGRAAAAINRWLAPDKAGR